MYLFRHLFFLHVLASSLSLGTGSFVSALAHVVQKEPDYILGKPHRPMFDAIKEV